MAINEIITVVLMSVGFFVFLVAMIGFLRFPDFYTRLHSAGMGDSLAVVVALVGIAIYEGLTLNTLKILLIIGFLFLAQPTGVHLLGQAAFRKGVLPWKKGDERQ